MSNVYFGSFDNIIDIESNFEVSLGAEIEILYAWYDTGNWEGDAFVIFMENGKLFEVNGSHCSCYGLEGQWSPEETSLKALRYTLDHGTKFNGTYMEETIKRLEREKLLSHPITCFLEE